MWKCAPLYKHVEFIRDGMKMFLPIPNVTCVLRVPNLHQLDDFVYDLKWRKHFIPYDTTGRKKPLTHLYISSEYSIYAIVLSIHHSPGFWSICLSHSPATEKKPLEIWKSAELKPKPSTEKPVVTALKLWEKKNWNDIDWAKVFNWTLSWILELTTSTHPFCNHKLFIKNVEILQSVSCNLFYGKQTIKENLATMSSVDINPVQQARINKGVLLGKHDQVIWVWTE